jgi:hypothetical protein
MSVFASEVAVTKGLMNLPQITKNFTLDLFGLELKKYREIYSPKRAVSKIFYYLDSFSTLGSY